MPGVVHYDNLVYSIYLILILSIDFEIHNWFTNILPKGEKNIKLMPQLTLNTLQFQKCKIRKNMSYKQEAGNKS